MVKKRGGGVCWWEGSRKGLPHWITVGLLLALASPHKHTHETHRRTSDSLPITFQICLDQCRASCPKPRGHSWTWAVWEARGVKPDNTQLLEPSRAPPHRPVLSSPHTRPARIPPLTSSAVCPPLENSFTSLSNYPAQWPSCRSDRTHVTT